MGTLRRWLKARLGLASSPTPSPQLSINLLEEPVARIEAPPQAGIDCTVIEKLWSVSRLSAIFRDVQRSPGPASLQAARHARHCLSGFWLSAPVDQLEVLYGGAIGDLQRQQLEGYLPQQPLADDERQWRDALVARLGHREVGSQRVNLLLALMPYFPPSTLQVEDALEVIPRWLLRDYVVYCQPELKQRLEGPAGLIGPAHSGVSAPAASQPLEMEPLSDRRGEAAMEWFSNEDALARMQALINLFGMDPEDAETLQELSALRRVVAQLWLDVEPAQLQMLYDTPVGLLTRSLHTAGFGRVLVGERDQEARRALASRVADLSSAGGVNALLAALPFYAPGKIRIADLEGIPAWLRSELTGI